MTTPTNPGNRFRVLALDSDETDLGSLRSSLQALGYEVVTCRYHNDAISFLREGGQEFVAVIANIDGSIGFQLVELVGRNMGLPMIVTCLCEDSELYDTAIVKGACLALVKQRLMDNLWLIWQLVLSHSARNNAVALRELASKEAVDQLSKSEGGSRRGERMESDNLTLKRSSHLVWTDDLNRKFTDAYNSLGDKAATPKKIMELMKVPGLRRDHIGSRLQKYRAYRKREAQKALAAKSSEENRGAMIIEPVSMNSNHNAEQLPSNPTQNGLSHPNTSDSDFRSSLQNMSMQPPHHRGTVSRPTMADYEQFRQLYFNSVMDNGASNFVPPNGVINHGYPIQQPTWPFHGVQSLESEHAFDASWQTMQSFQGNWDPDGEDDDDR